MPETLIEKPPEPIVIQQQQEGAGVKPLETQLAKELNAALDKRAAKAGVQPPQPTEQKPPAGETPKPGSEDANASIRELRKSRDEAIERIKKHEAALKERETEAKTLREQLADFDGTRKERDELKTKIGDLEKSNAEFKRLESVSALELSEPFQRKFVQGENTHVEHLKQLAGYADLPPDDLLSAINKSPKDKAAALDQILDGVGRYIADDIVQTVKAIDTLRTERAQEIARAADVIKERGAEREQADRRTREEKTRIRQEAWDTATTGLGKELGLTAEQINEAREVYQNNRDAGRAAEIVLKAHAHGALSAQVAELKAELAKYQEASPGIKAGAGNGTHDKLDTKAERSKLVREAAETMGWR